ncbi:MAG: hypothetical protein QME94_04265 [Anaerolineae bacterium]|nr:hypothetical protein [Anaerolineae bacterium]
MASLYPDNCQQLYVTCTRSSSRGTRPGSPASMLLSYEPRRRYLACTLRRKPGRP